jgi:hypothetical protein
VIYAMDLGILKKWVPLQGIYAYKLFINN